METIDLNYLNANYLKNIPQDVYKYGFCKTLLVRKETIHLKHIATEIFVRKSIDIEKMLEKINMNLMDYMFYYTNRLRTIYHFNRNYVKPINDIVESKGRSFFKTIELYSGTKNLIVLDFDGVITKPDFHNLYENCFKYEKVVVCTANPTVTKEWFVQKGLSVPKVIYANKGKYKKIKCLIKLSMVYDNIFYVDNESEYLDYAWIFGIKTYKYEKNKINYYTLKK